MSANSFPANPEPQMISSRQLVGKDNTSGKGDFYPAPDGVAGWSWGAFLLAIFWTARHKRWISFFLLVAPIVASVVGLNNISSIGKRWMVLLILFSPVISFFCAVKIGRNARLWTWQNVYWDSLEHFKSAQRNWTLVAFSLYALTIALAGAVKYPDIQREVARKQLDAKNEAIRKELVSHGRHAVADAVNIAKDVSQGVGDYILAHQAFPKNIAQAGFDSQLPDYVKSIEIDQRHGLIAVTMNVAPFIAQTFYLAPRYEGEKEILWRCMRGDFSTLDIPHECRYDATEFFYIRRK
ncbi:DUF2628 domain-containing protein [Undibacterium sp. TC9W]|uniref:DUF2628 domain-containing protein n=1 Tax=Undibacterium sp. TC9W TaxID=3413053 RepID=UPI003BF12F64